MTFSAARRWAATPGCLRVLVLALILAAAYGFTHVFSGRGALIHVGAFIGTIMAANVFMVIIPNQRKITNALMQEKAPDPRFGIIGKQRSLHNTYLTLPVLLMMISNHYPMITDHPRAWLLVGLIVVGGAMLRHFLVRHEVGDKAEEIAWTLPVIGGALALALLITEPAQAPAYQGEVSDAEALSIVQTRCATCHAAKPSDRTIKDAPKGIALETMDELARYAAQIEIQAVSNKAMPLGNKTGMTRGGAGEARRLDRQAMMTLAAVNAMTTEAFTDAFGDVAEHSPWVARIASSLRPFATREAMMEAFTGTVRGAAREAQLALIRAHPDLAAKAKLTEDSTREQAGAGLDTLTPGEFARFTDLNDRYKAKFGFPFIFAVKGATKHQILASFAERVKHEAEVEFATALAQVCRIFRFRIEDRVAP